MKRHFYYILIFLVLSCQERERHYVSKDSKELTIVNDTAFYKQQLFDGTLVGLDPDNRDTLLLQEYHNGLPDGVSRKWYPNRQLMEYREYENGRKNGKQVAYWQNGNKRFEFTAQNDACEGEMKEWSATGQLFHIAHYVNGQEEGIQKLWYENGKIRANYIIIRGKRYGLLGTKNCKNVSDSVFIDK